MKFIGNKTRLLDFIEEAVLKTGVEQGVFVDLFSGTASVGKHFKSKNFKVISNDQMYFSYVFQKAFIEGSGNLSFDKLKNNNSELDSLKNVLNYLNHVVPIKGFIFQNYCEDGEKIYKRRYFSSENAKKIDAIRTQLKEWNSQGLLSELEFFTLLAILIDRSDFIANNSGTYGAYLKIWRSMALKDLWLIEPDFIASSKNNVAHNEDALSLIKMLKGDILYLDPPYNSRQYAPNYHILETIALYDNPKIKGKTGIRENYFKSSFSQKQKAANDLEKIIQQANFDYILLSYNNEGIIPKEQVEKILNDNGDTEILTREYRRFRSESNHKSRNYKECGDRTKEHLYLLSSSHS